MELILSNHDLIAILSFAPFPSMSFFTHGLQKEKCKESGGGGAGAAGRIEGRAGADGQHDAGATQGRRAQSGAGSVVKKGQETLIILEYARAVWHSPTMKLRSTLDQIKKGVRIVYNDGRPGHKGVLATVLAVDAKGMTVQFDDRADTSWIAFSDRGWMDFIEVAD